MELSNHAGMGERIRFYRKAAGLTQKALADLCRISESAIRNYELGNRIPDYEMMHRIAYHLNVSYFVLADPDITFVEGAVHALFRMEKMYGLHPVEIDGDVYLKIEKPAADEDVDTVQNPMFSRSPLKRDIHLWNSVYQQYISGEVDRESYLKWQNQFPKYMSLEERHGMQPAETSEPPRKRKRKPKTE